jgi:hypothetical protein
MSQLDKQAPRRWIRMGKSGMPGKGRSVVPRFFFHVRGFRQELSRDEFGLDFPDLETACLMTLSAARDLRDVFSARGRNPRDYTIEVRNAADELVFKLPFTMAFDHPDPDVPWRVLH